MIDETDRLLREFLEKEREERGRGFTKEALTKTIDNLSSGLQEHMKEDRIFQEKMEDQFRSHRVRIEGIESKTDKLDEAVKDNREKISETRDELREVKIEFKTSARDLKEEITASHIIPPPSKTPSWVKELNRGAIGWVIKALIVGISGGLGALIHHLVSGGH